MSVKNIPIVQDPDTLEGQTQQFVTNPEQLNDQQRNAAPAGYVAPDPVSAAQQASVVPEVPKQDEILKRLYSINEPKPTLDLEKKARLQRMEKINQIGRGIGLMTDALSLGMGGSVKRRAPDNVSPAIYQSYQNMLDQHKNSTDNWNLRNTAQKRANIGMELNVEYKKQADQLRRDIESAKSTTAKNLATQKFNQWVVGQQAKEKDLAEKTRHNKVLESAAEKRARAAADKKKGAEEKPFKPIEVYDDAGNKVKRSQADWTRDYLKAQTDPEYASNIKALLSKYQNTPDGGLMQIANEYYNFDQQRRLAAKAASGNPAAPTYIYPGAGQPVPATASQPVGTVTGPSKEEMAKNAAQAPKKDWSKYKEKSAK